MKASDAVQELGTKLCSKDGSQRELARKALVKIGKPACRK